MHVLDEEDSDWRLKTVIMLDNASWHHSNDVKKLLGLLHVPVIYTGPYAFDGSPIESLFARIKLGELNPYSQPTGKR